MYQVQRHLQLRFRTLAVLSLFAAATCCGVGCHSNDSADQHLTLADFGTGQESDKLFPRSDAEPPKAPKVALAKPATQKSTTEQAAVTVKAEPKSEPKAAQPAKTEPQPEKKITAEPEKPQPAQETEVALAPEKEPAPEKEAAPAKEEKTETKTETKVKAGKPELAAGTGGFAGVIKFAGQAPPAKFIFEVGQAPKDPTVCAAVNPIPDQSLVVNPKNNGVKNAFVYLQKSPKGYKGKVPQDSLVFDQKNCVFLPHSLVVRAGQEVLVKNGDPIVHNTRTTGFNSAIRADDRVGVPLKYRRAQRVPFEVRCDFHTWMRAYHLVLDHPFAAATDEDGKFAIPDLPPGEYTFTIWQEMPGYLERKLDIKVEAGKYTEKTLSYEADKFASFQGPRPRVLTVSVGR